METYKIILLCFVGILGLCIVCAFLFLFFGWFKLFFHDVLLWHRPAKKADRYFDGCSVHSTCKYCGKEIIQDSQGNWIEGLELKPAKVKPEPVYYGKWRLETDEEMPNPMFKLVVCTYCNEKANNTYKFCPNCGKNMSETSE